MADTDYYAIIGRGQQCFQRRNQEAYRKLAMIHHPDKSGSDPELFKQISEAHSVLSDDQKRSIYDRFGSEGLKELEVEQQMKGMMRLQPLVVEVVCTLDELYNGCNKQVEIERLILEGDIKHSQNVSKQIEKDTIELQIKPHTLYGEKVIQTEKGHYHRTEDLRGDLICVFVP